MRALAPTGGPRQAPVGPSTGSGGCSAHADGADSRDRGASRAVEHTRLMFHLPRARAGS